MGWWFKHHTQFVQTENSTNTSNLGDHTNVVSTGLSNDHPPGQMVFFWFQKFSNDHPWSTVLVIVQTSLPFVIPHTMP